MNYNIVLACLIGVSYAHLQCMDQELLIQDRQKSTAEIQRADPESGTVIIPRYGSNESRFSSRSIGNTKKKACWTRYCLDCECCPDCPDDCKAAIAGICVTGFFIAPFLIITQGKGMTIDIQLPPADPCNCTCPGLNYTDTNSTKME